MPAGSSQALSGLHVIWLVLASVLVRRRGAGTVTGIIKGLVEMCLFSYHGVFVLIISAVEGLVVDIILTLFMRVNTLSLCLAGGLSSASNVSVTQLIIAPHIPLFIFAFMYLVSFVSGLFFAGYLSKRVLDIISSSARLSPGAQTSSVFRVISWRILAPVISRPSPFAHLSGLSSTGWLRP